MSRPPYPAVKNGGSSQAFGLLGWWPGSNAGMTLWDKSGVRSLGNGNLNIGTIPAGGRWTRGVDGEMSAVTYDGSTNRTTVVNSALYFGTARTFLSIALWVKTSNIAGYNYLFTNWGTAAGSDSWHLRLEITTGFPYFTFSTDGNYNAANDLTGSVNCSDGKWHHVVATRDGATSKVYVDGRLNASLAAAGDCFGLGSSVATMGGLSDGNLMVNSLNGAIDDPRLYSCALPAGIIRQMFDPLTRHELRYQAKKPGLLQAVAPAGDPPIGRTKIYTQAAVNVASRY